MSELKNIPEGWVETTLGKLVKTNKESIDNKYPFSEIFYLDTGSITEGKIEELQHFELINAPSRAKRKVNEGDIIYSTVRPNQKHYGYIENPLNNLIVSTGFTVINSINSDSSKYLYYWITQNTITTYLHQIAEQSASAYPSIKPSDIEKLKIILPKSTDEQKSIASILTAFDDKIQLLQAQNKTLEETAQTIFTEWFGKYSVDDNLPEGWKVGKLGDLVIKISKGTTPTKNALIGLQGEVPFLKVKDISNDGLILKNNLELIPKTIHENQLKRSILETDDILFSIAGTIGRIAVVDLEMNNSNCNQALAFIRIKDKHSFLEYIHLWLKSKETQDVIISNIVQGVQANVSLTVLSNLLLLIPSSEIINNWCNLIKPIYQKLQTNTKQIQTLTKTRDELLPRLMSGEVQVKQ